MGKESLLVLAVVGVGIFHTIVPDHWAPIVLVARARGWSRAETARAAFIAGFGHTVSTLAIGVAVWVAGLAASLRFGHSVSIFSSIALVVFGAWIALGAWREQRESVRERAPAQGKTTSRIALLLILGSSPMVEGIPAFFAAAKFGPGLLAVMSVCFAVATIATYVATCVLSGTALARFHLGPLERYGEVVSGTLVALVGLVFLMWPVW